MKVKMGKEKVQICQANEDWCNQPNGRGFVSFVKVILEKLNDGALIESLKRKLRSHSERKKLNVEADQISCFYSNGMTFGTIKAKRSTKVSGSITTTAEINYLTKSAASFEMSGGGGDRVPVDITNAFGAIGKQKGSSEAAQIAYIDSGANRHFVNRIVKLDDERKSNTLMMDATGRMNRLDSDGELTIGVVDENGKAIDPIIITASRNNSSPMNLLSVSKLCKQGMSFHFAEYDSYFMWACSFLVRALRTQAIVAKSKLAPVRLPMGVLEPFISRLGAARVAPVAKFSALLVAALRIPAVRLVLVVVRALLLQAEMSLFAASTQVTLA